MCGERSHLMLSPLNDDYPINSHVAWATGLRANDDAGACVWLGSEVFDGVDRNPHLIVNLFNDKEKWNCINANCGM